MKVVITVTAVYDLPDNVEIKEVESEGVSYGQHININGHKLQPVIEFLEYEGKVEDSHSWGEPKEDIDGVYERLENEEYNILAIEENEEE
ncbi:hypothetical protein CHISP_0356 [Chitinispirillum alkaliphilum]|nr:hypothetical protein CHISP_0356 [Chitinispirillum alkaliphilum]